ncbi:MAG: hypothetical protein JWP89_6140 [Schlesneria sp.]|nr:hypothetical protein [Schlesneria sp.]
MLCRTVTHECISFAQPDPATTRNQVSHWSTVERRTGLCTDRATKTGDLATECGSLSTVAYEQSRGSRLTRTMLSGIGAWLSRTDGLLSNIPRQRPLGEIGRHARLRILCRKASGFDSPSGHLSEAGDICKLPRRNTLELRSLIIDGCGPGHYDSRSQAVIAGRRH